MPNPFYHPIRDALNLPFAARLSADIANQNQSFGGCFAVSDLSVSTFHAIGEALAFFMSLKTPTIKIDQRLASLWYAQSLFLTDQNEPAVWDNIAGDYQCADGWIRLHTNAPHHKKAALKILGTAPDRDEVERAVLTWKAKDLETAIVAQNGCAAKMYSADEWRNHPQGQTIANEPLIHWRERAAQQNFALDELDPQKPLKGIKVLDITRVIAGPVATRTLAALGAEILRIDPRNWDEPGIYEELTIGKNCTHLDLKNKGQKDQFLKLLADTDIFVHGLRADALARLELGEELRQTINPDLIEIQHNAYGWTGPWRDRRGFDSLVQMSAGIAHLGMVEKGAEKPTPLPVQALDHATGYLLAAAAITALGQRRHQQKISSARLSLVRTAELLKKCAGAYRDQNLAPLKSDDLCDKFEQTHLGRARRLKPPFELANIHYDWEGPAPQLRSASPHWRT